MPHYSHPISNTLFNKLPGAAYRCKNQQPRSMIEVTDGIKNLTGYSVADFIQDQLPLNNLIHPDDQQPCWNEIQTKLSQKAEYDIEYRIINKSGETHYVWEHGVGVYDNGQLTELVGFISDLTPKTKQLEKTKQHQQLLLSLASSKHLALGELIPFNQLLAEQSALTLNVDRVSLWLFNQQQDAIDLINLYEKSSRSHSSNISLAEADYPEYFKAVRVGRAMDISDITEDQRTQEFIPAYAPKTGVTAMLDVSIRLAGEVIGVICYEMVGHARRWAIEDIAHASELADLTAQLIANKKHIEVESKIIEANAASKAKSQLLATISHEIRTPMNGVLGMVELLYATPLTPQQQSYLDTIRDSGGLLLTIINDVLDYSKLNAGKLQLITSPTAIHELFSSVIWLLQQTHHKKIEIILKKEQGLPEHLMLDNHRLKQVLMNLIANALKFTEQGSITVSYGALDQQQWFFSVTDTGIGIDPKTIPLLFEPFEQTLSRGNITEGTGLGLPICKNIVDLMQGSIKASSALGKGTKVLVTLPMHPAPQPSIPADNKGILSTSLHSNQQHNAPLLNVLVAEDNPTNRLVIQGLLTQCGISPDLCANGLEALEKFQHNKGRYDLILMDCDMPVMDGFTASRKIRQLSYASSHLQIAALTAHALSEFRQQAYEAGMNHYLTKPLKLSDLKNLLLNLERLPKATSPIA